MKGILKVKLQKTNDIFGFQEKYVEIIFFFLMHQFYFHQLLVWSIFQGYICVLVKKNIVTLQIAILL